MPLSDEIDALFAAIRAGDVDAVDRMLRARPALASARNASRHSAVTWACYARQLAVRDRLLAERPALDLFEAAAVGDAAAVRAHLARDPQAVRAFSHDGFTALHLAAYFAHPALVAELLAAGAEPAAVATNGSALQPLHSAAAARDLASVAALLERGAPPDARQAGGYTPLMAAAQQDDRALAEQLLAAGADPHARTDDGRAAADVADERGHHALAAWLRERTRPR